MNIPLPDQADWTFDLIRHADTEIGRIAKNFGLETYPNQLEIITAEQMLDAYSSIGMPAGYSHWSFGKQFIAEEQEYKKGNMGLAYEIVINSNPCIAYLMEENSLTMQALVIAHACYGHNSFFKGNYLFKQWTDAEGIIDYLLYAKHYITECETKWGVDNVEGVLDACHALQNFGVDRYKHPRKLSLSEEKARKEERASYAQSQINDLWLKTAPKAEGKILSATGRFPVEPEENILYFIEKFSPTLPPWKQEIVRIVRKIAQYFYPQRQTQVMNEGWATYWHYTILNQMYDEKLVGDGFMMEFLQSHSGVVAQRKHSRLNPYALGFAMMKDIQRICQHPTDEDRKWFPWLVGRDWLESLDDAMRNFKDESFILQYLSPKIIRDFHLYTIRDNDEKQNLEIADIHDDDGYKRIRDSLSSQYRLSEIDPNVQVYSAQMKTDRSLTLRHTLHNRRPLNDDTEKVIGHVRKLWGFPIHLETVDANGLSINVVRGR